MPMGWLINWALGGTHRQDANGLPNLNKDEIPPIPPVKPSKADEDYDPIIKKLRQVVCYCCKGIFWMDEKYNPFPKRYKLKRKKDHIAKSWVKDKTKCGISCPYCHAYLLPNALARSKRERNVV